MGRQKQVDLCKFEARLIYKVSSRTDKETLSQKSRKPKQNKTNKQKIKTKQNNKTTKEQKKKITYSPSMTSNLSYLFMPSFSVQF